MKNALLIIVILITASSYSQRSKYKNIFEKNGEIGIGTNQPDALLTVKGDIHAQEVLLDLKGAVAPDYVFETYFDGDSKLNPRYKFLSLDEIEKFVEKNHHLPGVPSALDLKKEGMSMKAMNLILLEKVEELTLHLIKQQNEIEKLKETIKPSEE